MVALYFHSSSKRCEHSIYSVSLTFHQVYTITSIKLEQFNPSMTIPISRTPTLGNRIRFTDLYKEIQLNKYSWMRLGRDWMANLTMINWILSKYKQIILQVPQISALQTIYLFRPTTVRCHTKGCYIQVYQNKANKKCLLLPYLLSANNYLLMYAFCTDAKKTSQNRVLDIQKPCRNLSDICKSVNGTSIHKIYKWIGDALVGERPARDTIKNMPFISIEGHMELGKEI